MIYKQKEYDSLFVKKKQAGIEKKRSERKTKTYNDLLDDHFSCEKSCIKICITFFQIKFVKNIYIFVLDIQSCLIISDKSTIKKSITYLCMCVFF